MAAPSAPIITEPVANQVVSAFDVHMQVDINRYSDPDGDAFGSTSWELRDRNDGGRIVWQALNTTDQLDRKHIHFGDGQFVGPRAGQTSLLPSRDYALWSRYTDARGEVSNYGTLNFRTASESSPVPGLGNWIAREGYVVERVAQPNAFRLAVNIAFVPNPGSSPTSPLYYVSELYGSIKVVRRDGSVGTFASNLLDYNPEGPFPGFGEQGLTGLVVDTNGDLYVNMLWENGAPPGGNVRYPKVERLRSTDGGQTLSSRQVLLNMRPETQGQSHLISTITIGPDQKLYVQMGDAFEPSNASNPDRYRGKILRLNKDGSAPTDNPFYNAADGINARDYTYVSGVRNPFGGSWRAADGRLYVAEEGNGNSRLFDVKNAGQDLGWRGTDQNFRDNSIYLWEPATAPVNMTFVQPSTQGGSLFPASNQDRAFISLSGATYASGPQGNSKKIVEFSNLSTRDSAGRLTTQPTTLVNYNGTGRSTVIAIAAGPDGVYFSDFYREDGAGGATASGSNIYRVRYTDFAPRAVSSVSTSMGVNLSWINADLASSYNIYRRTASSGYTLVGNTAATSFFDSSAPTGEITYMIRSVNAGGESEDSNESTVQRTSGSISGVVYNDANTNGVRESSEAGVSGRVVYIDTNRNFTRDGGEPNVTTGSDGSWRFDSLAPGGYLVRNEIPSGSRPISPGNSEWWHNLAPGQTVSNNFGVAAAAAAGTLSGVVYSDVNRNGVRDGGESGLAGRTVFIDSNRNSELDSGEPTSITDASGVWRFNNLTPGGYLIEHVLTSGFTATNPNNSDWWHNLGSGQSLSNDFGIAPVNAVTPGSIGGIVYEDLTLNGTLDANDPRLSGRFVWIDLNRDGDEQPTEPFSWTDAQGRFQFNNVAPGGYLVRHGYDIGAWRAVNPNNDNWWHVVGSGQNVTNNFGVARIGLSMSTLSRGRLWIDANLDRTRQGNERLAANIKIFYDADGDGILDKNEKVIRTNRNGSFDFGSLRVLDRRRIRVIN